MIFTIQRPSRNWNISPTQDKIGKNENTPDLKQSKKKFFRPKRSSNRSLRALQQNVDMDPKFTDSLYGILSLLIMTLSSFSVTVLPVNNVLMKPEYWYEIIFSTSFAPFFMACATAFKIKSILDECVSRGTVRLILELFLSYKITEASGICLIHLFWSESFGYYEPFPLRQFITHNLGQLAFISRLWYLMPKQMLIDNTFRNRWRSFVVWCCWSFILVYQLIVIQGFFKFVLRDIQWIVAVIVPVTKEINDRIQILLITKYFNRENIGDVKFIGKIMSHVIYSYWLAINVALTTTWATQYVLFGINIIVDLTLCIKIIRLHRKSSELQNGKNSSERLKDEVTTDLILNEYVGMMLPIAFIATFSLGYFGPNKDKLGNIGVAIWYYEKVEDIQAFLTPVVELALIDAGCAVLTGLLLWASCRINIFKQYCITIKKYWKYLAYCGGATISGVGYFIQKKRKIHIYNVIINDSECFYFFSTFLRYYHFSVLSRKSHFWRK